MSVVAFTFGSFGDIITTLDLLCKVAATLRGVSSDGEQALLREIQSLSGVLMIAKEIVERYYASSDLDLATNLAISVNQEVSQCRMVVDRFFKKVICYKGPLSGTSIKHLWKTVWWAATEAGEVDNLRVKLSAHRAQLNLFLLGLNLTSTQELLGQLRHAQSSSSLSVAGARYRIKPSIPQHVDLKILRITDVLGQVIPVPLSLCTSWDFLHGIMLGYFQGRLGLSYVSAGAYDFVDPDGTKSLNRSTFPLLLGNDDSVDELLNLEITA